MSVTVSADTSVGMTLYDMVVVVLVVFGTADVAENTDFAADFVADFAADILAAEPLCLQVGPCFHYFRLSRKRFL